MIREYKIDSHNSTVCGYPGREFDWSKFDWEGQSIYVSMIKDIEDRKAPLPWVDNGLINKDNQYLHVPYNFAEDGTIYRVRPNESMQAGKIYRGKRVKQTRAIKKDDGWYWQLEFEEANND